MTAAICWQSVCCNYWSNTNQTIIYWLLHFLIFFSCSSFTWGKKYIHYRRPIAVYNVITRWISVFSRIMTLIIICHQNDNDHDYQWDETLRTIPVASESIRFYMSTYSAHFTLVIIQLQSSRWFVWSSNSTPCVYNTLCSNLICSALYLTTFCTALSIYRSSFICFIKKLVITDYSSNSHCLSDVINLTKTVTK